VLTEAHADRFLVDPTTNWTGQRDPV
jgi:hypothetical protein